MDAAQTKGLLDLLQFGAGGFVLLWFMFRCEPRLRAMEKSMDRLAKAILLKIISYSDNHTQKEEAESLLKEMEDEREKRDNKH
jgi:hypothetical protein